MIVQRPGGDVVRVPAKNILGAAAVLPVLAACGGSSSGGATDNPPASAGPAQHPASLVGAVGANDAYEISLADPDGNAITNLKAGTYKLKVEDLSSIHNFHLTGPGVSETTSVSEKATKTFTIDFKAGDYNFVCDPHASQMHGSFHVT
jgi:plastocyanin